jgi:hypothetical protein|tara:strand:+ start:80 stop:250 length:171 start_codon:yes stop_codon:yes gene_type:complete
MNKYEIEEIISGDSARDEKIEIEESTCDWCITDSQYITDYSGMNLCPDCNNDGGYN